MLAAVSLLLTFQLAGEALRLVLDLPVPGPVLGLVMLLAWLMVRGGPGKALRGTTNSLLQHLSLLFVPAGTGVMLHLDRLGAEWLPIAVALLVSTVLGMSVAALVLHALSRRRDGRSAP